ncbi:hypothetical protein W97_00931 [Coniosporium apollinis CBS 100218]|uniref:Uncharacterized protein n=1 Tax=Coniosporium apollinis (strain CBS 100218) TaxID=1168221 RepID=R7YIH7_CONA1|nr:uncharacterized protein W97_00931 [Coniosporium apollinis CBS 100218]EON61715.1 hypothetical protein W97_00931 [Coniosporium apollinis CBS 100218]
MVVSYLPPDAVINLTLAAYLLLRDRNIIPCISLATARRLSTGQPDPNPLFSTWRLPPEITLAILRPLNQRRLIQFVIDHYQLMVQAGVSPDLTSELGRILYRSCAAEANNNGLPGG